MKHLYLVESQDENYDIFRSGVVWAEDAKSAKEIIRKDGDYVEDWQKLRARRAKTSGIVHQHIHFG